MDATTSFLVNNFKTICAVLAFIIGFYIQHEANTAEIERLKQENKEINQRLDAQYARLDNMKLDKAVFEATMKQFADMSQDIRQIRQGLEDLMKTGHNKGYAERR